MIVPTEFAALFSPIQIRDIEIRNRIATTALGWEWAGLGDEPLPPPELAAFWEMQAAGGAGLLITEPQSVHPTSTASPQVVENSSDAVIEPYRAVTNSVHATGARVIAHLNHAGHLGGTGFNGAPLWAPSAVRAPMGTEFATGGGVIPHEMTLDEIAEVTEAFAAAAARCVKAGFDGVEINAAEGFLLAEFLSPVINRRDDRYGGTEGRHRLLIEVVAAVRARLDDKLLGVRVGTDDHLQGGLETEDVATLGTVLAATGSVDYLSTTPGLMPHMGHEPGAFSDLAKAIKAASGLPVIYIGWAGGPETAEALLDSGACDLVAMSRALLADPLLPAKAQRGEVDQIRPCIACNACLSGGISAGIGCVLNPAIALAGHLPAADANGSVGDGKTLLVVGGGPAGMEAACILARRGHDVTLWERGERVGGQLRAAARAPHRERIATLADYLERELERTGVTTKLGRSATLDDVRAFGADEVIVATGARGHLPDVPGADLPSVVDPRAVLNGDLNQLGDRVLVVIARADHRFQGLTVAEFIAAQGREVRVVTDAHFAGDHWDGRTRLDSYRRLARLDVEFTPMVELVAIREDQVEMRNVYSYEPITFAADSVVLSYGDDAESGLLAELRALNVPVHSVGDVVAPRDFQAAFRDAATVTAQI
ncbi:MAG TPA: FAD-dependent oxidoreductase [Dehalococcoidia bacterium]|nr:FAD-dependent oxidoreductase [Dehalococcoidia bacterium]